MMNFYSAKNNSFYPFSLKADYELSVNGWPDDAVAISDDEYDALFAGQAAGKAITPGSNGKPVLSDPPSLTPDELIAEAKEKRDSLMEAATTAIAPLQDAVDIDDVTDAERESLQAWKKYRVALNRLDLSAAPDIDWPQIPA